MKQIADNVYQFEIDGFPPDALNMFLIGDVILDAGTRQLADQILNQVHGHEVSALALTHAHADHQGGSHAICTKLSIPLFCPEAEADFVESGDLLPLVPDNELNREQLRDNGGPAHTVARRLQEGDEVGGFVVVDAPGHSPGHVCYWREADRVLIIGDVLANRDFETGNAGLREPADYFSVDPAENRRSIRKVAALDPLVVCFGHGAVLREPAELHALVERLPED